MTNARILSICAILIDTAKAAVCLILFLGSITGVAIITGATS